MLYTRKENETEDYTSMAEKIIQYAEKSGFEEIKADFTGYDSPASLTMVNQEVKLTPDFSARRGEKKYYFELVVKNENDEDREMLVSKWKALESIARMKGGKLQLFVPRGSYRYASELVKDHHIEAQLTRLNKI